MAVECWRSLFSRIRGRCEYEVYSGSQLAIGTASASTAWLAPWPSSPAPSVPRRLRTFGVSAHRCPRVRVHSGKPNRLPTGMRAFVNCRTSSRKLLATVRQVRVNYASFAILQDVTQWPRIGFTTSIKSQNQDIVFRALGLLFVMLQLQLAPMLQPT